MHKYKYKHIQIYTTHIYTHIEHTYAHNHLYKLFYCHFLFNLVISRSVACQHPCLGGHMTLRSHFSLFIFMGVPGSKLRSPGLHGKPG